MRFMEAEELEQLKTHMKMKSKGHTSVRAVRLNWDVEYYVDIITGNGFTITEPATFTIDESKQKSLYGARSILYGTSYEDETAFIERYRCRCGEFKGKMFEGEICPFCKTPVQYEDVNIEYTGWISLGTSFVINPYYYNRLASLIGKQTLYEIVNVKTIVDTDGNTSLLQIYDEDEDGNKVFRGFVEGFVDPPDHPYFGIGIEEFREKFEEIMHYFMAKKKDKKSEFMHVLKESSSVFTSHIPVYSTFLRPQSSTADTYYYNSIDKLINPIWSLSNYLGKVEDIDKKLILQRIQWRLNQLWETNFSLLNKKEGLIRGQILGGSLNYTSRNVIVPSPDLKDDQVDLSYHTFLELFKFKILNYLMQIDGISLSKANQIWTRAYRFDKRVYEIMQFILKKEKPKILINRNPTLIMIWCR